MAASRQSNGRAMSSVDTAAMATALALMGQYGDDAEVIAMLRAAEYAAMGDVDGLAQWDQILACLASLSDGVKPDQLN
jgi:hypothetical protein